MQKVLAVSNALLVAGYPAAVYFGLLHLSPRSVGLLLLALLLPGLAYRLRSTSRDQLWAVLKLPLAVSGLVALAAALDDQRFVLALPVAINLVLLMGFGGSLRATPMIERFARLQKAELSDAQVRYCRRVTQVWCGFFALNAALSLALAWLANVSWWALYTGFIAYVLIGVIGASEYIVRKARFREYGSAWHDRLLSRVFPAPLTEDGAR